MTKYIVLRKSKHVNALDLVTIEEAENDLDLEWKLKDELRGNLDVLGVEYMSLKWFVKIGRLNGMWIGIKCLEKMKGKPNETSNQNDFDNLVA